MQILRCPFKIRVQTAGECVALFRSFTAAAISSVKMLVTRGLKSACGAASHQPLPRAPVIPLSVAGEEHEAFHRWNRGLQRLFAIEDISIFIY